MSIKNLLVATDFSEGSAKAEGRAAMLCKSIHCGKAEILAVEDSNDSSRLASILHRTLDEARSIIINESTQKLKIVAQELQDKYKVQFNGVFRFGQPAREIVTYARESQADLLVVGARGGGNFLARFILGSTADRLVRLTQCPLLVVKNEPGREYENILVPIDFSEESKQAARTALEMHPAASITLMHAYDAWYAGKTHFAHVAQEEITLFRRQAYDDAMLAMGRFAQELDAPNRTIQQHFETDMPGSAILKYAEKIQADLIVMGKHGRSAVEELLIGSVTRNVISQTTCDVLVVPSAESKKA